MIYNPRSEIWRRHTYDLKSNMWGIKVDVLMTWNSKCKVCCLCAWLSRPLIYEIHLWCVRVLNLIYKFKVIVYDLKFKSIGLRFVCLWFKI
jgi:hypothetical protein